MPNAGRMSVGKIAACRPGASQPKIVGPSVMPATTSPITRGCETFTASAPNRRERGTTIATASRNTATRCPNDSRAFTAVNFSPAGGRPDGVVSAGFVPGAAGGAPGVGGTGVATSSGITVALLRLRSTAEALKRALPPRLQARSPVRRPVWLLYVSGPRSPVFATAVYFDPLPSSSSVPPKQVERGESL